MSTVGTITVPIAGEPVQIGPAVRCDLPREDRMCPTCATEFTHSCRVPYGGLPTGIAYLPCGHVRAYYGTTTKGPQVRLIGTLTLAQVTEAMLMGD